MTTAQVSSRPFAFGRVVENTLHVLAKNPWVYLGLSAIFVGAPSLIGVVVLLRLEQAGVIPASDGGATVAQFWFSGIVGLFGYPAFAGACATAVAQLDGQRIAFGQALSTGLRHWLRLVAVGLLIGLGVCLGIVLLVVPGVILAVAWFVAVPASVIERLAPRAALGRSRALTRGRRWPIFGLLLLLALAGFLIGGLIGLFSGVIWGIVHVAGSGLGLPRYAAIAPFVTVLIQTVVYPLHAACIACVYAELRGRAGAGAETVAATFA
ncbi:MAG: hypothetical protein P4L73_06100 [Caulobacteraceae bacterium]|nr:hypothetical protein [Caulobacteraceae bacterium]